MNYLIGIDSGTQKVKAIVSDENGNIISKGSALHDPPFSKKVGWAEEYPQDWWDKLCKITNSIDIPSEITGIGISTERQTLIPVDRNNNPLRPAIMWTDRRIDPEVQKKYKSFLEHSSIPTSSMLWVKENEPDIYEKTYKFLGTHSWFVKKLTGEFADSWSCSSRVECFDTPKLDWNYQLLKEHDLEDVTERLPELHPPGEILGYVSREAESETSLPEGTPVVAGAADKQCETLGVGCTGPERVAISCGTAMVIGTIIHDYLDKPSFIPFPAAIPGTWNPEASSGGFSLCSWFVDQFGSERRGDLEGEAAMDDAATNIPLGSEGLMVLPHCQMFWPGWDPNRRGAIIGWDITNTSSHFYRAILEGNIYELRRRMERMEKDLGREFKDIRVCGGGAESDIVLQMIANVFGRPIKRTLTPENTSYAGSLGAAILAAGGGRIYKSVTEAAKNMTRVENIFEPDSSAHQRYDEYYEVYCKIDENLRDLHRQIVELGKG